MKKREFYSRRKPVRLIIKIIAVIAALLIIAAVFLFFHMQRYVVYTPEGARLDIPILRNSEEEARQQ